MLAQTQIHLQAAQRVGVVTEVVQALFLVAERDLRAQLDKLLNAALVADARTDKGNLFALNKLLQLLDRQHKYLSSGVVSTSYYIQNAVFLQQNSARQGGPKENHDYCSPPMGMPCLSSRVRILVIGSMMEETLLSWLMAAMK